MAGLPDGIAAYINSVQRDYYLTDYETLVDLGILGRIKLYDWTLELTGLVVILGLFILFKVGDYVNTQKVKTWINGIKPVLDENFFQVGVKPDQLYISDSSQLFTTYATGRVNIGGLTIKFELPPRQNVFVYISELLLSNFFESIKSKQDTVTLEIQPSLDSKINHFVYAIVNKEGMNDSRTDNYYLSLTKTSESDKLPVQFVFMSESNELNDELLTVELEENLKRSGSILKYLAVTDLPVEKPKSVPELDVAPKLILTLNLKTDKKSIEATKDLIENFIELADKLSKFTLKQEIAKKVKATRDAEANKIRKVIQDQKAEELKEKKLEEERTARRTTKLSPEEQDKLDRKQKEKRERRARNKQRVRM